MNNAVPYFLLYQALLKQQSQPAEVIVWLQGDRFDRGQKVLELNQQQFAKMILLSGNNRLIGKQARPGEENISLDEMRQWLVTHGVLAENIMVDDQSFNTKEQSVHILQLAKTQAWTKIIIVGSDYYQPRVFLTFIKTAAELDWPGRLINQAALIGLDSMPGGRNMTARQLMEIEAVKVQDYQAKGDLASYQAAGNYLNQ